LLELLKYVVPHFPFECPAGWPETAVAETNALNIAVCKILSVFMVPSVAGRHEVDSMEVDESQPEWVHTIIQYVTGALAGRVQFRHARASAPETQVLGERLTKAEYAQLVELLPVVKVMLGSAELTTLNSNLLIEAFNQVFAGCPAKSVSKRECIYFIADILLVCALIEYTTKLLLTILLPVCTTGRDCLHTYPCPCHQRLAHKFAKGTLANARYKSRSLINNLSRTKAPRHSHVNSNNEPGRFRPV
jgi:hypothetical protein